MKIIDSIAAGIAFLGFIILIMIPMVFVEAMACVAFFKILTGYLFHSKDSAYLWIVIVTVIASLWLFVRHKLLGDDLFNRR